MLLVDGRLNALITPRPARPAVVKAFIAMYCETGEVDVGLDIWVMFSKWPRILNAAMNTAKCSNTTMKYPYVGIPRFKIPPSTITAPSTVVMITDCSKLARTASNHLTPICLIRPGIIQPSRNNKPTSSSRMNPTMAITPYNTSASSSRAIGIDTNVTSTTIPSRPKDCPRIQSHCECDVSPWPDWAHSDGQVAWSPVSPSFGLAAKNLARSFQVSSRSK
jgi:hypothetical protein